MALKTKDGTFDSKPANYERDTHPAGINFELKDGTALFAPYSFLSHALYDSDEIVIHYSFGVVRVRGDLSNRFASRNRGFLQIPSRLNSKVALVLGAILTRGACQR